jgi:hypothetical protein
MIYLYVKFRMRSFKGSLATRIRHFQTLCDCHVFPKMLPHQKSHILRRSITIPNFKSLHEVAPVSPTSEVRQVSILQLSRIKRYGQYQLITTIFRNYELYGLFGRIPCSPAQGIYLQRKAQHRENAAKHPRLERESHLRHTNSSAFVTETNTAGKEVLLLVGN